MTHSIQNKARAIPKSIHLYFDKPELSIPSLSYAGDAVCYLKQADGLGSIVLKSLVDGTERILNDHIKDNVPMLWWSFDDAYVLFVMDCDGNENYRLYSICIGTGTVRCLTPYDGVFIYAIHVEPSAPERIGFMMNKDDQAIYDYYVCDLKTGALTQVYKNDRNILDFFPDAELDVMAMLKKEGLYSKLLCRIDRDDTPRTDEGPASDTQWHCVDAFLIEDGFTSGIIGLNRAKNALYYMKYAENQRLSLFRYDLMTQESTCLYTHETYDVDSVLFDATTRDPLAVGIQGFFNQYERLNTCTDRAHALLERCEATFSDDYFVVDQSFDGRTWLVKDVARNGRIRYYVVSEEEDSMLCLGDAKPWLQDADLFEHRAYAVEARDGLKLEGYITYPGESEAPGARPLPLVISVHGGPWWRDSVQYITEETAWLASLGFIVININFRGSTGYGLSFLDAGNKEWGKKMNTDLIDAIMPLIENGTVDAEKVGIFGMSYGGYATLAALAFSPDFFKFGVDRVGPSDIKSLLDQLPPQWGPMQNHYFKRIGHPEEDIAFLRSISPLYHAPEIKSPLMIAQGFNDPRVKYTESENIVQALKERGVPVEYLLFEDEGHILVKQENIFEFYSRAMAFLERFV